VRYELYLLIKTQSDFRFHFQPLTMEARFQNLAGTKWHWTGISSSTSISPLSVSLHQCPTLIFIYMLLLPEGQTGETWKPSKKECSLRNREALDTKVLSFSFGY